jgi:hypothetical protein
MAATMAETGTHELTYRVPKFVEGEKHHEANAAAEFPQLFNFPGSIFGAIVISVSIKTMWILHQQRFCPSSFKPYTIHPDVHLLQKYTPCPKANHTTDTTMHT